MAMAEMPGPYDVREYQAHARGVATNTCPMAPYRGVSRPVITFALERLMDKAARAFGLDPVDIRRRNLIDKFPYTSATGLVFDEATYKETLEMAVEAIDVPAFRARQKKARAQRPLSRPRLCDVLRAHRLRQAGLRRARHGDHAGLGDRHRLHGSVRLRRGAHRRLAARPGPAHHAGADHRRRDRRRAAGDQDRARRHRPTPYGWGTFASRSLVISGGATLIAARKVRAKLIKIASHMLEAAPDDIVLEDGDAKVAGTDRAVPIAQWRARPIRRRIASTATIEPGLTETGSYDPPGTFSNACHVAIVEVDIETGGVTLEKFLVAEDAGRIINPMIADGQVHGGVAQGIGNALLEEIVYDETGNILTATLADYLPPTAREIPPIELHHMETPSVNSITKAKGLGEGGAIGAPAAVINAINDALSPFGVSIDEMPATPQRIRAALRQAGKRA